VTSNARRCPLSRFVVADARRFVRSSVLSPAPSRSTSGSVIGSIVRLRPRWTSLAVRGRERVGARLGGERHRLAGLDGQRGLLVGARQHEQADRAAAPARLDHDPEPGEQLRMRTLGGDPAVPVAVERRRTVGGQRVRRLRGEREQRDRSDQ